MFSLRKYFFFILTFSFSFSFSQPGKIDSLVSALETAKQDTQKVKMLNDLAQQYVQANEYDKGLTKADEALALSKSLNYIDGIAGAYRCMAFVNYYKGNYRAMLDYLKRVLPIRIEQGNKKTLANLYGNLGVAYWSMGDYANAQQVYLESLKICEEINDKDMMATNELNLGILSWSQGKYSEALDYYKRSLQGQDTVNDKRSVANIYSNMANVYHSLNDLPTCLEYNQRALSLREALGDSNDIADSYINMANILYDMKELGKADAYEMKALNIKRRLGDKNGEALLLVNMSTQLIDRGKIKEALDNLKAGLSLAGESGDLDLVKNVYETMHTAYLKDGNYKMALESFKKFVEVKDSLLNEANIQKITEAQMTYEFEKKQREEQLMQEQKDKLAAEENKRQAMIRNFLIAGCFAMLVIAILIFRSFTQTRKANQIIASQKQEVELQKAIVDQKNKDVTDSINYAKRIQEAVFPEKSVKTRIFPEAFVYFRPRDIVSGDFYWFGERNGKRFIAAVDCTGHGVPGAFMSIIGNHLLNEIVMEKGILKPSDILDQLHVRVRAVLKQEEQKTQAPDGMDIALCCFSDDNTVEYAGAHRPLYLVSKGVMSEIKADKFPIGGSDEHAGKKFNNHVLNLKRGDVIYISSDGYADQFGGATGKKMMSRNFKELLLANADQTMPEQEKMLDRMMEKWKGSREQVDDILVIGVRV